MRVVIGLETVDGVSFDIKEILKHNHQNHVSHYNDDDLNHDYKNAESNPRGILSGVAHCCTPHLC